MDDNNLLVLFYLIKRIFLFLDEWLLYYILFKMYVRKMYLSLSIILVYGSMCILTSYHNINLLEEQVFPLGQKVFVLEEYIVLIGNQTGLFLSNQTDAAVDG